MRLETEWFSIAPSWVVGGEVQRVKFSMPYDKDAVLKLAEALEKIAVSLRKAIEDVP